MTSIKELVSRYRRVVVFGLIGVMNTAVDFAVYSLLIAFSPLGLALSQAAGYSAGLINSFIMNRCFTFRNGATTSLKAQVPRFLIVNGITLAISILCLSFLVNRLGMNQYLAKVPVTVLVMIVNYLGYKLFVFGIREGGEHHDG
ncbi:GtrA family protein [Papillibacter cinnamivorans]|uniref:Putative flippase GtrA (Transmembrane translocase of bactoprenol-linked glucose) n=1 Tax=Papillibacter cinnamivorans DSM 12816 TaxID=1122930 RepID=A0A1W2BFH7_9FIRM|nr:GtrA family protein [Papillibacter cinnamivorans]SMC71584.1 Putative flippase GtrA (transmembrane translocase of bactoprenol-linked glucose) [Papillibacter cinnamivorans DSM 12816]